jgi:hypothetical protein
MILTLDIPEAASQCAASAWRVHIAADPLTSSLGLKVGASYTWQKLLAPAAAAGFPVGHPILALVYALREMSAQADAQGRPAPVAVVVSV